MESVSDGQQEKEGISFEKPYYYLENKVFIPFVYDTFAGNSSVPREFNSVTVRLDGTAQADLNWSGARSDAQSFADRGYKILWEIDLGLFSGAPALLSNRQLYVSLSLSLEHFRNTLWKEFGHCSLGLIVYRGDADFTQTVIPDEQGTCNLRDWLQELFIDEGCFENETGIQVSSLQKIEPRQLLSTQIGKQILNLFCMSTAVEYLSGLTSCLPDFIPKIILLDASSVTGDLLWQSQVLYPDLQDSFLISCCGAKIPQVFLGRETRSSYGFIGTGSVPDPTVAESSIGLCIPPYRLYRPSFYRSIADALNMLTMQHLSFRIIPESRLIMDWDGLSFLFFEPDVLSPEGLRRLRGFCAAGGIPVTLGRKIGLPGEISLAEFCVNEE